MAVLAGQVEGHPTGALPSVRRRRPPFVQQQADGPVVAVLGGEVERGPLILVAMADRRAAFQQQRDYVMKPVEEVSFKC